MEGKIKKTKISYFDANITSIISVSLVLLLLGIVGLLAVAGHGLTNYIKENIGFDVVVADTATPQQILTLKQKWAKSPYVSSVKYISKEDALRTWQEDTGEDLIQVLGVNPLSAEFEVRVKAEYSSVESLNRIESELKRDKTIESIQMHKDVVEQVNKNIQNMVMILTVIATMLLIISYALINNTVRLTVYSRRFLIHTMKLVGAKPGFIRRPIVVTNILNGIIAALVAMVILSGAIYYMLEIDRDYAALVNVTAVWIVYAGMLVFGVVICGLAALMAANKFIRLDYDDLFTK